MFAAPWMMTMVLIGVGAEAPKAAEVTLTKDGGFRLADVPPGEYRLELSHPAGALHAAQTVRVRPGETVMVEFLLSPDDHRDARKK